MRRLLTATLLTLAALPATAAPAMQPGLYDISMQMMMKGTPMEMPVMSFRQCLTAQDIDAGKAYASGENKRCAISNLKQESSAVSYDFVCAMEGGNRMVGRASGTHHATGYDILMSGRFVPAMDGMSTFDQMMRAKRIGPCN